MNRRSTRMRCAVAAPLLLSALGTLPGGAGHVVVAAFLSAARGDDEAREHALALVGRAVFDHYAPR
jgi:hypothetical protein